MNDCVWINVNVCVKYDLTFVIFSFDNKFLVRFSYSDSCSIFLFGFVFDFLIRVRVRFSYSGSCSIFLFGFVFGFLFGFVFDFLIRVRVRFSYSGSCSDSYSGSCSIFLFGFVFDFLIRVLVRFFDRSIYFDGLLSLRLRTLFLAFMEALLILPLCKGWIYIRRVKLTH